MKPCIFTGCATALVTPFKENGQVDFDALDRLVDFQLQNGVDALVVCGTTGEPATMTSEEWTQVVRFVIQKTRGRVPVIVGTSSNNPAMVLQKAQEAQALGADAQLCVTPYYNKATQNGLYEFYAYIAKNTVLPLLLYNVPSRTGVNMLPSTVQKLSVLPGICGLKEATGDAAQAADILHLCGDEFPVYSGADECTLPLRALGGKGVISVLSNIAPKHTGELAHLPLDEAGKLQVRLMPLIRALFCEVNPIPVKYALSLMGLCENVVRLPLTKLEETHEVLLKNAMKELHLI